MSRSFNKREGSLLSYRFNWGGWLDGDTVAASTFTVTPAGLTTVSTTNTTSTATIKLSGGNVGTTYSVLNRITTAGGLTDARDCTVTVVAG